VPRATPARKTGCACHVASPCIAHNSALAMFHGSYAFFLVAKSSVCGQRLYFSASATHLHAYKHHRSFFMPIHSLCTWLRGCKVVVLASHCLPSTWLLSRINLQVASLSMLRAALPLRSLPRGAHRRPRNGVGETNGVWILLPGAAGGEFVLRMWEKACDHGSST
jgi:hypothetical protein